MWNALIQHQHPKQMLIKIPEIEVSIFSTPLYIYIYIYNPGVRDKFSVMERLLFIAITLVLAVY